MNEPRDLPIDPADLRQEYTAGQLNESQLSPDPIVQFTRWFADAEKAHILEPNAMTLATADATGRPSARIVLLKGFDHHGFVFFTNYSSRKARELAENPRASLVLFWGPLERQVRIQGEVGKVGRTETEQYFHSRPRGSQIGAWVSHQSGPVSSHEELARRAAEIEQRFGSGPIPVPDFWGGYRLVPTEIEFWQGRPSRLHDRLLYSRSPTGWTIQRLAP